MDRYETLKKCSEFYLKGITVDSIIHDGTIKFFTLTDEDGNTFRITGQYNYGVELMRKCKPPTKKVYRVIAYRGDYKFQDETKDTKGEADAYLLDLGREFNGGIDGKIVEEEIPDE